MLLPSIIDCGSQRAINFPSPANKAAPLWLDGGVAVLDENGTILEVNPALAGWLKKSAFELAGEPMVDVLAAHSPAWGQAWEHLQASNEVFHHARWETPATELQPARWFKVELTRFPGGKVFRLNSLLPSVPALQEQGCERCLSTEPGRRAMFFQSVRAQEQLAQLMQRWPGIVFNQRPDGSFYFVSPKIEELTGVPLSDWERGSNLFWEIIHEADLPRVRQQFQQATRSTEAVSCTFRIRHKKTGKVGYVVEHRKAVTSSNGLLLGYEGVWLDHTRQTVVEQRLAAAAWKDTLTSLTMGLIHDFRNSMAGIVALTEAFQEKLEKTHQLHEGLTLIRSNAWQASQSVQRIFQLYHSKSGERAYHDLNELTREIADMSQMMLSRRVSIQVSLAEGQLPVYVDGFEFRQAFLNLVVNARDAMPQGGRLVLTTKRHETLPAVSFLKGQLQRLPAVCLSIADTGPGIPNEHLAQIFDPFFTTKGPEKGSGLGLYNVQLFVEKHGGAVSVESVEGLGAVFHLWLPEADFHETEPAAPASPGPRSLLIVGAQGAALDGTALTLRKNGFEVNTVLSSVAACEELRSSQTGFDGVILQTTAQLPGFFADIKKQDASVKTILQIIGCNPDEANISSLGQVDMVISADAFGHEIAGKIHSLLAGAG